MFVKENPDRKKKLEQFSVIALLKLRALDISQQWQQSIPSSLKIALNQKNSGPKNMPQIILTERTTFLQEMLISIKTCHFHGSINHQELLFHRTLITSHFRHVNIAKFLRTAFLQNTSRSIRLRCSSK